MWTGIGIMAEIIKRKKKRKWQKVGEKIEGSRLIFEAWRSLM
jgi:hypothetical protein